MMWIKVAELASEGLTYYHDQSLFEYTTKGECRARLFPTILLIITRNLL